MFLQVFYMIPSDTQSIEELSYAFSRFIIQGKIIAHMVLLDVHYTILFKNSQNSEYYIPTSNITKAQFLSLWEAWKKLVSEKKSRS